MVLWLLLLHRRAVWMFFRFTTVKRARHATWHNWAFAEDIVLFKRTTTHLGLLQLYMFARFEWDSFASRVALSYKWSTRWCLLLCVLLLTGRQSHFFLSFEQRWRLLKGLSGCIGCVDIIYELDHRVMLAARSNLFIDCIFRVRQGDRIQKLASYLACNSTTLAT